MNIIIAIIVIALLAIGVFVWNSNKKSPVVTKTPTIKKIVGKIGAKDAVIIKKVATPVKKVKK